MLRLNASLILLTVCIAGISGCGASPPQPSDPSTGQEMLRTVLEAWKQGDSHQAYQQKEPTITVVEPSWKKGATLIEYELSTDSTPDGYDVQFKAKLVLKDSSGKQSTQRAVYNVSTTPAKVIVRAAQ